MVPSAAYCSIKSGRMPSDENSSTLLALPTIGPGLSAPADPAPIVRNSVSAPRLAAAGAKRRSQRLIDPSPIVEGGSYTARQPEATVVREQAFIAGGGRGPSARTSARASGPRPRGPSRLRARGASEARLHLRVAPRNVV